MSGDLPPHLQQMVDLMVARGRDPDKSLRFILFLDECFRQGKTVVTRQGTPQEKRYTGWNDWTTSYLQDN